MRADQSVVTGGPPPVKNPKHKLLADYFLKGGSQTQAAIDAGYSVRSASAQAGEILNKPEVAAYVAWMRSNSSAETQDIQSRIIQELTEMGLENNIEDLIRIGPDGEPIVDFSKATRKALKSVTGISNKVSQRFDKDGNHIGTEKQSSFRYADKYRGLELLGRAVGMFKPDEQRVIVDVADRLLQARQRLSRLSDAQD